MTGKGLICRLGEIQDIEGADRIGKVDLFGETLVVSKDHQEGELGILFDCETQLSHEYCHHNNLYRDNTLNKDTDKTGYIGDKRRVKPISLKGVKVSGLWMPIKSLSYTGIDESLLAGTELHTINSHVICTKYIAPKTRSQAKKNKEGKARKKDLAPTFKEHFDTDHWARNSHKVKKGDLVYITEKLHGTSFRCGNMPVLIQRGWFKQLLYHFSILAGNNPQKSEYDFVVGSRRVVKSIAGEEAENKDHYYGHDLWTEVCTREFKDKLNKGETVYGEIVGYDLNASAIMGIHSNEKLKPFMNKEDYKDFITRYGDETRFSYGTDRTTNKNLNKVFVYRITQTSADGETIDLPWEQVKRRCQEMNVDHVPELYKSLVSHVEDRNGDIYTNGGVELNQFVNQLTHTHSDNFPDHLNEGVCVRIENEKAVPQIYKDKRWEFKVLEGIIKDSDQLDIEEAN